MDQWMKMLGAKPRDLCFLITEILLNFILFYVFGCFACRTCTYLISTETKRSVESLNLELQVVVSYHVHVGVGPRSLARATSLLNH